MPPGIWSKLAARGFEVAELPLARHVVVAREGFAALIERRGDGAGRAGTPGVVTEKGMAMLVWRNGRPFLVARGLQIEATEYQVEGLRSFATDLEEALRD